MKTLVWILCVAFVIGSGLSSIAEQDKTGDPDEARSLNWLRSQIVPNDRIPTPHSQRRGLILSYAPPKGAVGSLYEKSFSYDAAIAAVALGISGDWSSAARILDAMIRIQREDGSYWFSNSVTSGWPEERDHDSALVRTGAASWVGYAFAFYLKNQMKVQTPGAERQRQRYLASARRAADFALSMRTGPAGAAPGLVRGGQGEVKVRMSDDGKQVLELYQDRPIRWISTEHNIATYFFLATLGRVLEDRRYLAAAEEIREKLLTLLWHDSLRQFATGFDESGKLNVEVALDCASWGALFLLATGEREKARVAVESADRIYRNKDRNIEGHRPYHDEPVYDDPKVQRFFLPAAPDARWKDISLAWSEGSLGVALAHLRLGNPSRAREIVAEMSKMRDGDGVQYSSRELPYLMSGAASVAGTAWLAILQEAFKDPGARGFWLP